MRQRNLDLVLALAGTAGVVALFLPFTYDVSPLSAIQDGDFWDLSIFAIALPFFLTIPILVASIRAAMTSSVSKLETAIAYILGGAAVGSFVFWLARGISDDPMDISNAFDWLFPAAFFIVPLFGIALLIRDWRKKRLQGYRPVLALQIGYLGNTLFCLVGFSSDPGWQAGAYLSLVTAITYLVQIGLAHTKSRQAPATG